jgi:predicted acyltransferase (DUF342 family)
MAFVIFAILFCLLYYAHFALAHRAWLSIRGRKSSELDMAYVRMEDYFGHSFRSKLKQWMESLPQQPESTAALKIYNRGHERIFRAGAAKYPAGRKERELLVIEGDFSCGRDCEFENELMIKGNGIIGEDSHLQALAADGTLHLGAGTQVRRWVDARGSITIAPAVSIASRVTSLAAIEFHPGCRALSLFAPEVGTEGRVDRPLNETLEDSNVLVIPHGADLTTPVAGYDPARLFAMGGGTYLYDGSLALTMPVQVRASLVVRGDFRCAKDSLITGSLKAHGSIEIGAASLIKGNLIAARDLILRPNTLFQGLLHAGGSMLLSRGVRGLQDRLPVAAYSAGIMTVESNVAVQGKLASATYVTAVSTPIAWLEPPASIISNS